MKYTANHKLKLPEPVDTLDIEVLDENFINIDALIAALQSGKADKNSPSLTGTPTAPTASSGTNSTQIATTAFVQNIINNLKQSELKSVSMANSLDLISASGRKAFYHGTLTGFFEESSLLDNVQTTFGQAVFGAHYGTFSAQPGSEITLYIRLYFDGSQIRWDEYYNDDIYANGEPVIRIGTATVSDYQAGATTYSDFSYINDAAEEPKEYSIRDAIYELAKQVQFLNNARS